MGFRLVEAGADRVVLSFDIAEAHRQPYGIVHGGAYCGAVESAASHAPPPPPPPPPTNKKRRGRHQQAAVQDRPGHLRPGLRQHRVVHVGDHLHRRRRRHPALPRLPDRAAGRAVDLPRGQLPAHLRRAAQRRAARRVRGQDPPAHPAARGPQAVLRRLPARRAPDAGAVLGGVGAVDLLPGLASTRSTEDQVEISTVRLLAKLPTIAAYAYKKSVGQPFLYPDNSLGLVENFLRMTFGFPAEPYEVDPVVARRWTCCSSCTPTTSRTARRRRCAWSARRQANLFASVSAGINALFGPLHGGANQAVLEMLEEIQGRRRRRRHVRRAGQEQGARRPADGLRPPGLQELRPARGDRQGDCRRGAVRARQARRPARHRHGARGASRSTTTTSSSASSTRTSTSTPA